MRDEEKKFLIAQKKKGCGDSLLGIDRKGQRKEDDKQDRIEKERKRKQKSDAEKKIYEPGNKPKTVYFSH